MVYRWSKLLSVLLLLAILQCAHMHVQMHHEWEENEERKIIEITLSTAKHKSSVVCDR
jgi:hypothetical protein